MDRKPSFIERLGEKDAFLVGTWAKIASLETVELLGHVGFDFAVVDMEHAPHSFQTAYQAIATAQSVGMYTLARLPDRSGSAVQRLLDGGIDGLLVPRVETPAIAAEATAAMAFPPLGSRGMGYTSRAARWGLDTAAEYLERGRNHVMRGVQIEDMAALEQIDGILEAPALNAVFIGFGDLALSSGLPGSHPTLRALEAKVLAAAKAKGVPCGTAVQTPDEAVRCREAGYSFVMISADTTLFAHAARKLMTDTRSALGL
ncbi:HpcH/HpaI aldolase family protein [Sphingobium phenoxybenzoativorans]|uniref:HpcH/HpaI aldolase family protein n=1 Tax=Sphingobium phenoxybenzoativorans TaxID=1592790 RepID=UPI0008732203|nr:aldolase/citrate lyase family protein [Sphingobium phenoxybenzoativorans]